MYGAIIGDYIGSLYEHNNLKSKEFPLFSRKCKFTDDSVMTCAIAYGFYEYMISDKSIALDKMLAYQLRFWGKKYSNAGYGSTFRKWLADYQMGPYESFGNGSAMRVSPVAWFAESLEQAMAYAEISSAITHNHPEGIKGAQAVAACIFLARLGKSKDEIKQFVEQNFYPLDFTLDSIREEYNFDVSCQGSVPQAIVAFLESDGFEDAIRNAISIGGDSDTIAAIAGSIAEAFYGVPQKIMDRIRFEMPADLLSVLCEVEHYLSERNKSQENMASEESTVDEVIENKEVVNSDTTNESVDA